MSLVDDFMLAHNPESDTTMGTVTMVCNSQTFQVVDNLASKSVDGEFGGLEPQVRGTVTAQPKDVSNPKSMLNKRCTVDGVDYRVSMVDIGKIAIHFTLSDPNER
jgi:hypothetical protein